MTHNLVVSGTDTGIGKTVFAAALTAALGASYWKPIQAGLQEETDSETVMRLGGIPAHRILAESWRFASPTSPHHAAALQQAAIQPDKLTLPTGTSSLIIEGAGGLLVPLTHDVMFADVFARWQVPVILCARTALGTINHTLLSLEAMRHRAIPIAGVVFIGHLQVETERIIANLGRVRILGRLPWLDILTPDRLQQSFNEHFTLSSFQEVMR